MNIVRGWYLLERNGLLNIRFESGPPDNANYSTYAIINISKERAAKLAEVLNKYAASPDDSIKTN